MKKIKMKNQEIKAYELEDLDSEIQEKVIADYINFLIEIGVPECYQDAVKRAEKLQTPWFTANIIYEMYEKEIREDIKLNGYLYDKEGNQLPVRYYTKNGKIIKTVLEFGENEIEVNLKEVV